MSHQVSQSAFPNTVTYSNLADDFASRSIGITASQTLFNGNQTANRTRQAESGSCSARETCASPSSRCCSTPQPPIWICCAISHPRPPSQQRRGAHRTAQADPRPLQCRRSHPHRRRPGRIAARGRPLAIACLAIAIRDLAGAIPAHHRRRSRQARARHASRPAVPPNFARRDLARPGAKPVGACRRLWRRRRRAAGEGQRRRALSEPRRPSQRAEGWIRRSPPTSRLPASVVGT